MITPYSSESATTPLPSLTGLLMCEHCRIQMLPHSIGPAWTEPQYVCPATRGNHPTGCMTPTLPCRDLDRRVLDKITSHLLKVELMPDLISAVKEDAHARIDQGAAELQRGQDTLKNLAANKLDLVRTVEDGTRPYSEVSHLVEAASLVKETLDSGIKADMQRLSAYGRVATDDAWIVDRARDTDAHLATATASARIELIHMLVNEITVNPEAITISYAIPVFGTHGRLPGDREEFSL